MIQHLTEYPVSSCLNHCDRFSYYHASLAEESESGLDTQSGRFSHKPVQLGQDFVPETLVLEFNLQRSTCFLNKLFLLLMDCIMPLFNQRRFLHLRGSTLLGIHSSMINRNLLYHCAQEWSISSERRETQSVPKFSWQAFEKST